MPRTRKSSATQPAWTRPVIFVLAAALAACAPFQRETRVGAPKDPGAAALLAARSQIGAPYRFGGSGPEAFDCSGLVTYAYHQAGIDLPRTAEQQFAIARPVRRRDLAPGDLVFFRVNGRGVSHVGIYAGDDRLIDAPQSGGRVRMVSLDDEWYRERYAGAGRPYLR